MSRRSPFGAGPLAALLCASALLPAGVRAQEVPERRLGVHFEAGSPRLDFSAIDLADRSVREKLRSGLAQQLVLRIYAYAAGRDPIAVSVRSCRVTFDLWEEVYRVELHDVRGDRNESHSSLRGVLQRCLRAERVRVGRASDYAALAGEEVYFAVLVELNPLSPDTVHRLRRWLSRPAGGGRVGGEAFFGSFVSLFVNRQIGAAERTRRFRSQRVTVPAREAGAERP